MDHTLCGTSVLIKWKCSAGHVGKFWSSHKVNGVLANNLQACGAVLLSVITLLKLKGLPSFWVCLLYQGRHFIGLKGCIASQLSMSGGLGSKELPIVYSCVEPTREKNIVLVVSPLINLMKDQVSRLNSRGISAISLSDVSSEQEIRAVENRSYSIVYGSPESWLGETKWRKMLSSDIYQNSVRAVAVDEAHVICHWGKSKSNKHAAFRVWFSRLHEFRSLLPPTPFIALTATAIEDTRETIFEVLLMNGPHIVTESPNKANISYVVQYMGRNASLAEYLSWISNEVKDRGSAATRTIIYTQTIKQCAVAYSTLKTLLGDKIYSSEERIPKTVLLEMLHSCTPQSNKEHILTSFQSDQGSIRILVDTIAFGMGVDCKQVHRTVHFGPAKNVECYMQESGRAGRDGAQSTAFLLYQGMQLMHVDKDIKNYVKEEECRRKHLLSYFDVECPPSDRLHLCCDNCSVSCKCGLEDCKPLCYPLSVAEEPNDVAHQERNVSVEERKKIETKLGNYHKLLLTNLTKRDASGKLKYFTHPKFILGFSELQIRQEVFGDLKDTGIDSDDEMSDEEEEFFGSDWNDLALDDEMATMFLDNLSCSQ
ncbi:bifunctional 3'-5' exonuclease/ATP-dependent helicase WRN-like [Montipora foliosa]|uniref:bifunctional 3'-5' exonuclease/ATP-dependent helicase WRN-like n=1 Tax=Montipora foliosa TaxID=591990 RepID=UPI0035F10A4C